VYFVAATHNVRAHCEPCDVGNIGTFAGIFGGLIFVALVMDLVGLERTCQKFWPTLVAFGRLTNLFTLHVKLKIIVGFCQIASRIDAVYELYLPGIVRDILAVLRVSISFGLEALSLECWSGPGYRQRLDFWMAAPVVLMAILVGHGVLRLLWRIRVERSLLVTLASQTVPMMLRVLFLAYPIVTNVAFEAFACMRFDDGSRFLITDLMMVCDSDEHLRAQGVAVLAILLYPVGVVILIALLLRLARSAIMSGKATTLSTSTSFLHRDFLTSFFYWELVEMLRRFLLVGLFVAVPFARGSMMQLALACVVAIIYLVVQVTSMPYLTFSDNFVAITCSTALVVLFIGAILFKYSVLIQLPDLQARMGTIQKETYELQPTVLTGVLVLAILSTFIVTALVLSVQLRIELKRQAKEKSAARARRLRRKRNDEEVPPPPIAPGGYHMFLSHVWGTGQDQMRIIKQRLLEMIPGLSVFLDVDDLEDISNLQGYIERTQVVMIFCSQGYFKSKNCMIEIRSSVHMKKPIQPLMDFDQSRGGMTREQVKEQLIASDGSWGRWGFEGDDLGLAKGEQLFEALFELPPIEWNRIGPFQDITMKQLAGAALQDEASGRGNYLQGELTRKPVRLPRVKPEEGPKYHLYVSLHNPGAAELVAEVNQVFRMDVSMTSNPDEMGECAHFLCYLTGLTWTCGERSEAFAAEVRRAMDGNVDVMLAHEMTGMFGQEERHGCEFGDFFACAAGTTPGDLLQRGIYSTIAVALKGGTWREVSMVLLIEGIGEGLKDDGDAQVYTPLLRRAATRAFERAKTTALPSLNLSSDGLRDSLQVGMTSVRGKMYQAMKSPRSPSLRLSSWRVQCGKRKDANTQPSAYESSVAVSSATTSTAN